MDGKVKISQVPQTRDETRRNISWLRNWGELIVSKETSKRTELAVSVSAVYTVYTADYLNDLTSSFQRERTSL